MKSWKTKAKKINSEYRRRMKERGEFQNDDHEVYYMALALCGEAGELANLIKKHWRGEVVDLQAIKDEVADVRIYLEHIASLFNIDVDEAVGEKLNIVQKRLEA